MRNLADYLAEAKDAGCWVYGAAAKGTPYRQPDYTGGVVLVMGAEGTGLRPRVRAMCDDVVSLPMRGRVDSLNVSPPPRSALRRPDAPLHTRRRDLQSAGIARIPARLDGAS